MFVCFALPAAAAVVPVALGASFATYMYVLVVPSSDALAQNVRAYDIPRYLGLSPLALSRNLVVFGTAWSWPSREPVVLFPRDFGLHGRLQNNRSKPVLVLRLHSHKKIPGPEGNSGNAEAGFWRRATLLVGLQKAYSRTLQTEHRIVAHL